MSAAIKVPAIFTAIDKFTRPLQKMSAETKLFQANMARMERSWRNFGNTAMSVGRNALFFTAAVATPLIYATKMAVEFEDKMADVGKTTGMQGVALEKFGEQLLEMSTTTRTSIDDLVKIGEIGGQLGIAEKDLLSFTEAANKFNVALGGDFTGGTEDAIRAIGGLKTLFEQTRDLDVADSITRTGSALNALSSKGVLVPEVTEFMARIGQLPDAIKPTIQETAALGAVFNKLGITSEISSRALGDVLLTGAANLDAFSKQIGVSNQQTQEWINNDPIKFITELSRSFDGLSGTELSEALKSLKLQDSGSIKVIGALSSNLDMLAEFQGIANDEFKKGTSLLNEYNTKNSTSAAQWEILKNNLKAATITLGKAFLPVLVELMKSITPVIKSFGKWAKENKPLLTTILKIVAGLAAFSGAISIISFGLGGFSKIMTASIKLFTWYNSGTKAAMIATKLFSTTLMGMPLMWVIAGVAALVVGIYALTKSFKQVSTAEKVNNEVMTRMLENTAEERTQVMMLTTTLKHAEQGTQAYNDALAKLDELQPGIVEKYNLQEKSIKNIIAAEKELINAIMERAKMQAAQEILQEKFSAMFELQMKSSEEFNPFLFGGNSQLNEAIKQNEISQLQSEIDYLGSAIVQEQMKEVNPEQEKQSSLTENINKETITVDFKNVPIGTQITGTGGGAGFNMPSTSSTR